MKEISAALVKAQRAFGPALKTSTNPHYKSKYADLGAVIEAVIDALNDAGIFLMQMNHESDTGVTVETLFIHDSGETISAGRLHVPAVKMDAQGYGSALTYARRYSLMAACGIAPEDDDGNSAKSPEPELKEPQWTTEQDAFHREQANHIIAAVGMDDIDRAHKIFYRSNLDNDEKLAIWSILKPHSSVRSAIKSYDDGLREIENKKVKNGN